MIPMTISGWLSDKLDNDIDIDIGFVKGDRENSNYVRLKMTFNKVKLNNFFDFETGAMVFGEVPLIVQRYINVHDLTDNVLCDCLNELYNQGLYRCDRINKMSSLFD